jgi:integrase
VNQTVIQNCSYLISRNGIFYFSRRVPADLLKHFNKDRVIISLRTKSKDKALRSAATLSDRLERHWESLRLELFHSRELGLSLINHVQAEQVDASVSFSDALKTYLRLKGHGRGKTFFQGAQRSIEYLKDACANKLINDMHPSDASLFRDYLFERGMSSASVKRVFASVKSIINLAIREHGLGCSNVFAGAFIPDDAASAKRLPIPNEVIRSIQEECLTINDENRWLVALISDTGMRLSEAAGLHLSDFYLDEDIPYIDLKPQPWRSLKTKGSKRQIPLIGSSLWAAKKIAGANGTFAFPRYIKGDEVKANSASAAINKWLKPRVPAGCVIHSFRHSLRDRLRSVECPSDVVDAIGGWATSGIGQRYGTGYSLTIKNKWMKRIEFRGRSFINP